MLAGLVLIISARGFGDETDHDTDFIVLTKNRHTRYPSGMIGLGLRRLRTGFCSAALQNFCDASKVGRGKHITFPSSEFLHGTTPLDFRTNEDESGSGENDG